MHVLVKASVARESLWVSSSDSTKTEVMLAALSSDLDIASPEMVGY
jgi:hypothetical protein